MKKLGNFWIEAKIFAVAALLTAAIGLAAVYSPHGKFIKDAIAQPTNLGPNIYAYTAVTASQQIVPANPTRHALQICNPGGTNILWIAPQNVPVNPGFPNQVTATITPAANGAGTVGVPVTASGTVPCFAPPTNAPSLGAAWAGFSTTTPVTVYEWP